MIKLLIADDEPIIRETISSLIDWESLGIKLIGTAADGIEAYNIILDEYPDIVLTDIKMPGLSGLELIDRIKKINQDTEFIILSGYDDFNYAQKAMGYGVKQYLLKPSSEAKIIKCVQDTIADIAKKHVYQKIDNDAPMINNFDNIIIWTIINDSISSKTSALQSSSTSDIYHPYSRFLDFNDVSYDLYYLYFIEESILNHLVNHITKLHDLYCPRIEFTYVYVHNTLIFFYKSFGVDAKIMDREIKKSDMSHHSPNLQYTRKSFENLKYLLDEIIPKIRRYDTIFYSVNNNDFIPICNYRNVLNEFHQCLQQFKSSDKGTLSEAFEWFKTILESVTDLNLLNQIASFTFTQLILFHSPGNVSAVSEKLIYLNHIKDRTCLRKEIIAYLDYFINTYAALSTQAKISDQIKLAITENLHNPNLSLKWIAENILFMNVDYLSRKFIAETNVKFSKHLTQQRIQRSKILLQQYNNIDNLNLVIEQVGCGNNPQYFNQIFKKEVRMTPIKYIKQLQGDTNDK